MRRGQEFFLRRWISTPTGCKGGVVVVEKVVESVLPGPYKTKAEGAYVRFVGMAPGFWAHYNKFIRKFFFHRENEWRGKDGVPVQGRQFEYIALDKSEVE